MTFCADRDGALANEGPPSHGCTKNEWRACVVSPFAARAAPERLHAYNRSSPDNQKLNTMTDAPLRFTVLVEPMGRAFDADDATSLLQAAALAHIVLPSSCRNGTCRTCMCRMLEGQVRYSIEWPGLSADEKKEGFILPCVAHAQSDLVIEVPRAVALFA